MTTCALLNTQGTLQTNYFWDTVVLSSYCTVIIWGRNSRLSQYLPSVNDLTIWVEIA